MIQNANLIGVPLLVLANKQDLSGTTILPPMSRRIALIDVFLADCMGVREVKPLFQDNAERIGSRECMVLPTSGLTGDGVEEGIEWLVDCVKRNIAERPPKGRDED